MRGVRMVGWGAEVEAGGQVEVGEEGFVVADHQEGALVGVQGGGQLGHAVEVEVVGRLVQDQQLGGRFGEQQGGQAGPEALAAGQAADRADDGLGVQQEAGQLGPQRVVVGGRSEPGTPARTVSASSSTSAAAAAAGSAPGGRPDPSRRRRAEMVSIRVVLPEPFGPTTATRRARAGERRPARRCGAPRRPGSARRVRPARPSGQVDPDHVVVADRSSASTSSLLASATSASCPPWSLPADTWAARFLAPATIVGMLPAWRLREPLSTVELDPHLRQLALLPLEVALGAADGPLRGLLLDGERLDVGGVGAAEHPQLALTELGDGRPRSPAARGRG